jgi:hypothetical protein
MKEVNFWVRILMNLYKINFWKELLSDDFSNEGFVKRNCDGYSPINQASPIFVYIGNYMWEHKFIVKLYPEGVALGVKNNKYEWFLPYKNIQYSDEYTRPFKILAKSGRLINVGFGCFTEQIKQLIELNAHQDQSFQ